MRMIEVEVYLAEGVKGPSCAFNRDHVASILNLIDGSTCKVTLVNAVEFVVLSSYQDLVRLMNV